MKFVNGLSGRYYIRKYKKARFFFMIEGMMGASIAALLGGAFLTGFLGYLGVSTEISAIILQIPLLVSPIQLLSPVFFERRGKRLPIMRGMVISMRSCLIIACFLAMAAGKPAQGAAIIAVMYFLGYTMSSFADPTWVDYLANIVPAKLRVKYLAMRNPQMLFVGAAIGLVMSTVLDRMKDIGRENIGYIIIFITAAALLLVDIFCLSKLCEPGVRYAKKKIDLRQVFTLPLKNWLYRRYVGFSVIYNFSLQFANAYFTLYLVRELALPFWYITSLSLLSNFCRIISGRVWGRLSKRLSDTEIIIISCLILAGTYTTWTLVAGNLVKVLLPVVNITAAIGLTGIGVGIFSANVRSAPREGRTVFFAFNSCLGNAVGFIAGTAGALFNGAVKGFSSSIFGLPFGSMQVMFIIEGLLMVGTACYAALVLKPALEAKDGKLRDKGAKEVAKWQK